MLKRKYQKHPFLGLLINRKAQISVEYLLIMTMALAIIVPGSLLFYRYSEDSNEKLVAGQINQIGKKIVNNAEEMNTIGKNSWITLDISFPKSTRNVYVSGNSALVIVYQTSIGLTEAVFFSDVSLNGTYSGNISQDFHSGFMKVKIESKGEYVSIQESIY